MAATTRLTREGFHRRHCRIIIDSLLYLLCVVLFLRFNFQLFFQNHCVLLKLPCALYTVVLCMYDVRAYSRLQRQHSIWMAALLIRNGLLGTIPQRLHRGLFAS